MNYFLISRNRILDIKKSNSAFLSLTSYNDFATDHTLQQFYDVNTKYDIHQNTREFNTVFATSVTCQQGMFTFLPDTWFFTDFFISTGTKQETKGVTDRSPEYNEHDFLLQ